MPAIESAWYVYLVMVAMIAFMLSLGLVSITDHDPQGPPAE